MTEDRQVGTVEIPASDQDLPEGWLSGPEAVHLQMRAAGRTVLEVGTYLGRSTVAMARTAALVVTVDHHVLSRGATLVPMLRNLERYAVRERVVPVVADFRIAAQVLAVHGFDFCFIDGAHDTLSCLHDSRVAARLCRPGTVLCFHDHQNDVGVASAVAELGRRWKREARLVEGTSMAEMTTPI